MKSALFVQANVAVKFFKKFGQKRAISVCYDGKIFSSPPRRQHFREKFLGALFDTLKCP